MYISMKLPIEERVKDEDAFKYACESCRTGGGDLQEGFFAISTKAVDMEDFAETLVEWFFARGWKYIY